VAVVVAFDWLGESEVGSQFHKIIGPARFETGDRRTGRKEASIMRKIPIMFLLVLMLTATGRVQAAFVDFRGDQIIQGWDGDEKGLGYTDRWVLSAVWTSGHHIILDGDWYGEIWMYENARATMFGGEAYKLETYGTTAFDMLDGQLRILYVHDYSIAELYGGHLESLGITESAVVNLYAYDVNFYATGGYYRRGRLEGRYLASDSYFSFDLITSDSFSHINVIPEPTTVLLFGLGGLLLRKRD
jgi:hypothetical protein